MYGSIRKWLCERLIEIKPLMDCLRVFSSMSAWACGAWRTGRPRAAYPPIVASTAFRSTLGKTGLVM